MKVFHFEIEFYKDVTDIFVDTFKIPNTRLLFCLKIYFVVGAWARDVWRNDGTKFQHFLSRLDQSLMRRIILYLIDKVDFLFLSY